MLYNIFDVVVQNCEWHMNKGKGKGKDDGKCVERMKMWWTGNETVKGVWNTSISKLAQEKKLLGVYVGDELLGGGSEY